MWRRSERKLVRGHAGCCILFFDDLIIKRRNCRSERVELAQHECNHAGGKSEPEYTINKQFLSVVTILSA